MFPVMDIVKIDGVECAIPSQVGDYIRKLQAENVRLQGELEEIVGERFTGFTSPREAAHHHVEIARRALAPEGEKQDADKESYEC